MSTGFTGMHWMLATPFDQAEDLDTDSIPRLVEKAREVGCNGLVVLGVTGEAARLTDRERRTVAEKVIESAGDMPVTVGTSAAGTRVAIEYSKEARSMGAAAVMVAAPSMLKPNLDVLFAHYQRIADAVDLPIVVQDYPPDHRRADACPIHRPPGGGDRGGQVSEAGGPAHSHQDRGHPQARWETLSASSEAWEESSCWTNWPRAPPAP